MTAVTFSIATKEDDAGVRALLGSTPMPGRIRVRFEREPDYFAGCAAMGSFTQTLVARDGERIVGLASRSIRRVYINGAVEHIGYLGHLRVHPDYRGRLLVARGYRELRTLHGDGRAAGYVTTIVDGNSEAEGILVRRPRPAMPQYRFIDSLVTLAIPVGAHKPATADDHSLDDIREFVAREGSRRQFFPVLEASLPPGLEPNDFVTTRARGSITGVAALWDQRAFKQTVIDGYSSALSIARPFLNGLAAVTRSIGLPRPGSQIKIGYGSYFRAADDDPAVVWGLIEQLLAAASRRGCEIVLIAFAERDPSLAVARRFRHIAYRSALYSVGWQDGENFHDRLDARPAYLDVGTL